MRKLILIAGMKRSGSTWMYNAVRLMLKDAGKDVYGSWIDDYDESNTAEFHVVKTHKWDKDLAEKADIVFTSRRDLIEVIDSMKRFGIWKGNDDFVEMLIDYQLWYRCADYSMEYESIGWEGAIYDIEAELFDAFSIDCINIQDVIDEIDRLQPPEHDNVNYYDTITLLHPNHITRDVKGN